MLRQKLRTALDRWSRRLASVVAWVIGAALVLLAIIGNLMTARDLLGVRLPVTVIALLAVAVLVANGVYRLWQRAKQAEGQRDAAQAALAARRDPADVVRVFLRLHDQGPVVLAHFEGVLESLPDSIPEGRKRYAEWVALCTEAIEQYRPAYALKFRQAQVAPRRGAPGLWSIVKVEGSPDRYVSMDEIDRYRAVVEQAMAVLAEIVREG